jgi:hypothetical protein
VPAQAATAITMRYSRHVVAAHGNQVSDAMSQSHARLLSLIDLVTDQIGR